MFTEFVSVQLTREELREIHAALVQRAILEDELREERGQEAVERRPLLETFEALMTEPEEALHRLDHQLDDELWEHAWYAFTDEWARFRAGQDVDRELGKAVKTLNPAAREKLVDMRYQKNFEMYVSELAMTEGRKKTVIRSPQDTPGSR